MKMTQTILEKLTAKYGPQSDDAAPPPEIETEPGKKEVLSHWKDSGPVVMLSAFLKEYNDQGFSIQQTRDGSAVMHFEPGLKGPDHDRERWELAEHAIYLLDEAREDLKHLISIGALTFPEDKDL
jgi:hypothetical protein